MLKKDEKNVRKENAVHKVVCVETSIVVFQWTAIKMLLWNCWPSSAPLLVEKAVTPKVGCQKGPECGALRLEQSLPLLRNLLQLLQLDHKTPAAFPAKQQLLRTNPFNCNLLMFQDWNRLPLRKSTNGELWHFILLWVTPDPTDDTLKSPFSLHLVVNNI